MSKNWNEKVMVLTSVKWLPKTWQNLKEISWNLNQVQIEITPMDQSTMFTLTEETHGHQASTNKKN